MLSIHLHLDLPSVLFPSGFPKNNLYTFVIPPYSYYMPHPPNPPRFDYSNYTWLRVQITKLPVMKFFPPSSPSLLGSNILLSTVLNHSQSLYLPKCQKPSPWPVTLTFGF
jgi:hypothetical protein